MEFDDAVISRRTCRDYKSKDLPMEILGQIIDIARYAPSSANVQNWQFIVVVNPDKREKLSDICSEQSWMADAPVHLIVCNRKQEVIAKFPSKGEKFASQNCAIIATHIMLKANDLGVGSAWVGAFDEELIRRELDIPDEVIPECIITLGYPNELEEDQPREGLKFITSLEKWGGKEIKKEFFPLSKHIERFNKKTVQASNRAKTNLSGSLRRLKDKIKN